MGNFGSRPRHRISSQIWNHSEPLIIQTWILKIYCSCEGCTEKVEKVLRIIDGVHNVTIDAAEQKVTFTATVTSADVLLKKLQKSGKHVELWALDENKQQNEAKSQKQREEQRSGKDVGGDKKEHAAMVQSETQKKPKDPKQQTEQKPKDPKQQTEQKPGSDGGGNANENAAVAQRKMQNQQKAGRHEDNGQVEEDPLCTCGQIVFKIETLIAATNHFHDENKIGEGAFGPVYKGTTQDGKKLAVKKLSVTSKQGPKQFLNEVELLAQVQHRNLVKLLGYCAEESESLLIYEYFPNTSLDKFLFDPDKSKDLQWQKRFNIILGMARGLLYLHEDSRLRIVHRDIKASNILLDEKLNPKIADFGTAKVFPEDETHVSTGVVGTRGYMAPEYLGGEQLSVNVDVYSFGIVLLELVTGKKISSEKGMLLRWVWSSYKRRKIESTIDPAIIETSDKEKALRCIHVGLLCTQADALRRPLMSEVTAMLSTSVTLPVPTTPPGCNVRRKKVRRKVNPVDEAM